MTTVVIGGHARKVGKTSVAAGLIHAFRQYSWTAVKISSHWHEAPPAAGTCVIHEEKSGGNHSDSARYLAAGAARSYWIRIRDGQIASALPEILPVLRSSPFVIIESNSILRFIQPDLSILVLRCDVDDFKDSARETLRHAHAAITIACESASPVWRDFVRENLPEIPLFAAPDPQILPDGLLAFVKARLQISDFRFQTSGL
jgi:hypothetical protein